MVDVYDLYFYTVIWFMNDLFVKYIYDIFLI
jgi:hypothetical protein